MKHETWLKKCPYIVRNDDTLDILTELKSIQLEKNQTWIFKLQVQRHYGKDIAFLSTESNKVEKVMNKKSRWLRWQGLQTLKVYRNVLRQHLHHIYGVFEDPCFARK